KSCCLQRRARVLDDGSSQPLFKHARRIEMRNGIIGTALAALTLFGCGDDTALGEFGEATAALTLAPRDARCVVITTVGSTTVTKNVNVNPSGAACVKLHDAP